MNTQLEILSESLDKKYAVLLEIQKYNEEQEKVFLDETVKLQDFDAAVEEKGKLIEKLSRLDTGFEALYQRLADELQQNRERYGEQIKSIQQKIAAVTDLSISIQAQEARNKRLIEDFFSKERAQIKQGRQSSKAAYDYYKNMSKSNFIPPQFMDSKQ